MESNRQIPALQKVTLPTDHHFREDFPYQNSHTGVFRGMRVSTFLKETKTEPRKVNTAANLKVIKGVVVPVLEVAGVRTASLPIFCLWEIRYSS